MTSDMLVHPHFMFLVCTSSFSFLKVILDIAGLGRSLWMKKYLWLITINSIILEGDLSSVIKALQDEDPSLSAYGFLIDDVNILSRYFSKLHYSHTKREDNKIAHKLARHAINVSSFVIWMESIPPNFFDVF